MSTVYRFSADSVSARQIHPREAHQMLEWIRQLYELEDRACEWSVDARRKLRARESNSVLDRIEAYLVQKIVASHVSSEWTKQLNIVPTAVYDQ